ncbi:hypothetical protein N7462_002649 [Penicillium macrosclerotiorum]|uniref:uncharacterized protein n=1 Tax=Penicillium macrosclerotiorum TaxID=303699 RepID=UPI002547A167|nr:uncharacterized protein N7462_002649 [Penicillium macrosclerotiorum]KAJ5693226.1 hypothetical protein N7462_002649 [Penicillium macrosclerotiorum]
MTCVDLNLGLIKIQQVDKRKPWRNSRERAHQSKSPSRLFAHFTLYVLKDVQSNNLTSGVCMEPQSRHINVNDIPLGLMDICMPLACVLSLSGLYYERFSISLFYLQKFPNAVEL